MSSVASATKRRASMRSPQGKAPREPSSASSTSSKAKRSRRSSTATTGGSVDLGQLLALGGGREGEEEEWENGGDANMTANTADINLLLDVLGGIDRQQREAPRDRRTSGGGRRNSTTKAMELDEENDPAAINDENTINAVHQSASPAAAVVNGEVTMRSTPAGLQQQQHQARMVMNTNNGSAIRRRSSSMNRTTSNSGRKSSLSRAPLREASPAALSSQQQQQQQPPTMRGRRMTADIVDIQQLQAALNERSNQSTSPASPQGSRRDTADPESLRCLISLLRSPGPSCPSSERVVAPLFLESAASAAATALGGGEANGTTMITTMEPNESRVIADNSQIVQLIEDLEISLIDGMGDDDGEEEGEEEAPAAAANDTSTVSSMSSGSQRRASMEVARRLTADPQLLESLIAQLQKGSEADVSTTSTTEEEQRRLPSPAPLSSSTASNSALKKGGSSRKISGPPSVPPTPSPAAAAGGSTGNEVASSQQQQRRTTASPTSFAWLLDALPGGDSLASSAAPSDSSSTAQGHKSPRVNRRRSSVEKPATVPTPAAPAAASNGGGGAAAGPTTSTTTQVQGQTFSMSPPRLPVQGSTRKLLRSCLSLKKERPPASPSVPGSAAKKSVIFGSPGGAVFHKGSPTTSLTPMTKGEVMRYFPQEIFLPPGEGAAEEEEEVETGVTAKNSAILARWENDQEEEDEAEGEEEEGAPGSASSSGSSASSSGGSSNSKRKRGKSPRPRRRQSMSLPHGSPGFYSYDVQHEDDEEEKTDSSPELSSNSGKSLNDRLEQAEMEEEEEAATVAMMDVSPQVPRRSSSIHEEEMPNLEDRSSSPTNFRVLDQRTAGQLGIIGGHAVLAGQDQTDHSTEHTVDLLNRPMEGSTAVPPSAAAQVLLHHQQKRAVGKKGQEDHTVELENDLESLVNKVNGEGEEKEDSIATKERRQSNGRGRRGSSIASKSKTFAVEERTVELETDLNALLGATGVVPAAREDLNESAISSRRSSMSSTTSSRSHVSSSTSRRETLKENSSVLNVPRLMDEDSDDSTLNGDDEDAQEMRLSLDDSQDSLTSSVFDGDVSNSVMSHKKFNAGHTFSLSFSGHDDDSPSGSLRGEGGNGGQDPNLSRLSFSRRASLTEDNDDGGGGRPVVRRDSLYSAAKPSSSSSATKKRRSATGSAMSRASVGSSPAADGVGREGIASFTPSSASSRRRSSTGSAVGGSTGEKSPMVFESLFSTTAESSPFGHIAVGGRLRGPFSISSPSSSSEKQQEGGSSATIDGQVGGSRAPFSVSSSSSSERQERRSSGAAAGSVDMEEEEPAGTAVEGEDENMITQADEEGEEGMIMEVDDEEEDREPGPILMDEEEEESEAQGKVRSSTVLPSAEWARIAAFAEDTTNITRLVASSTVDISNDKAQAAASFLQRTARSTLLENCQQIVHELVDEEDRGCDLQGLKSAMQELLDVTTEGSEQQKTRLVSLIPMIAVRLELDWRSMESQVVQMLRIRMVEEVEGMKAKNTSMDADGQRLEAMQMDIKQAIEEAKNKSEEAQRNRMQQVNQRLEQSRMKLEALLAKEQRLILDIASEETLLARKQVQQQETARVQNIVEERQRVGNMVRDLEQRGRVLRGLHLWQPVTLTSDQVRMACPHPDGSQTEVRLVIENAASVTEVHVINEGPSPTITNRRRPTCSSSPSRTLLLHLLRNLTIIPSLEEVPPTLHENPLYWSWSALEVSLQEITPAILRLEKLMGRINMLVETIARVEIAYPCSLVLGEAAIWNEAWTEDCLYGACTTCKFDHGQGATSGSSSSSSHSGSVCSSITSAFSSAFPSSTIIAGGGEGGKPSSLLPHCSAILLVNLQSRPTSKVTVRFLLSLAFVSSIPVRIDPPLDMANAEHQQAITKVQALLNHRLGFLQPNNNKKGVTSTTIDMEVGEERGGRSTRLQEMLVEACLVIKQTLA